MILLEVKILKNLEFKFEFTIFKRFIENNLILFIKINFFIQVNPLNRILKSK